MSKKCLLSLDYVCDNEGEERDLFVDFGRLKLPACDDHYQAHLEILALNKLLKLSGEEIMNMSRAERVAKITEFNIDINQVNLK